jgi:hypothetical protein
MGNLSERAVDNHKGGYTCSGSVLCAFADAVGLTEPEARRMSSPMAGGRMGKCGAVLAAEKALEEKYGAENAAEMIAAFEEAFTRKNKSVVCSELRGQRLRPCRGCVQDAAEILEQMLSEPDEA